MLAVRQYARRNHMANSKFHDLTTSKNFQEVGQYLEEVDKYLENILPNEEKPPVDKYWRIIIMYQDKNIWEEDSEWKDANTLAGQTASVQHFTMIKQEDLGCLKIGGKLFPGFLGQDERLIVVWK